VAVKELPLLEELELSLCPNVGGFFVSNDGVCGYEVYRFVSEVCPQLKRFRLSNEDFNVTRDWNKNKDVGGIAGMHGLRSLQLFGNGIDNEGLQTVLHCCPHLESLDIRHCFNVDMDETLLLKCARLKTLRLPDDPTDDYDLEVKTPIRMCAVIDDSPWSSDGYDSYRYQLRSPEYLNDFDSDSGDDTDFFGEPSRYECDLDKYDMMLPMSMRTFLK